MINIAESVPLKDYLKVVGATDTNVAQKQPDLAVGHEEKILVDVAHVIAEETKQSTGTPTS